MKARDLYFKVKKVEISEGIYRIGVLIPLLNDRSSDWFKPQVSFDEERVKALLSDGTTMVIECNSSKLTNTRITDDKAKEIIASIIKEAKKNYKQELEFEKAFNEYIALKEKVKQEKDSKIKELCNLFADNSGFIDSNTFLKRVSSKINEPIKDYKVELKGKNLIEGIELDKEVFLGKWLDESSYDFIYVEDDDTVMIVDDLEESADFQKIKKSKFSDVKNQTINGATLKSVYNVCGGGDKRSAVAYHTIKITFPKKLEKNEKNLIKVAETINATLRLL